MERVRAALRAGAQPQQICGKDSLTRRALRPDAIAHGPDGDVLILARFGRVTMLGLSLDATYVNLPHGPGTGAVDTLPRYSAILW